MNLFSYYYYPFYTVFLSLGTPLSPFLFLSFALSSSRWGNMQIHWSKGKVKCTAHTKLTLGNIEHWGGPYAATHRRAIPHLSPPSDWFLRGHSSRHPSLPCGYWLLPLGIRLSLPQRLANVSRTSKPSTVALVAPTLPSARGWRCYRQRLLVESNISLAGVSFTLELELWPLWEYTARLYLWEKLAII